MATYTYWLQQNYIREWIHGQGLKKTLDGLEKFLKVYLINLISQRGLTPLRKIGYPKKLDTRVYVLFLLVNLQSLPFATY